MAGAAARRRVGWTLAETLAGAAGSLLTTLLVARLVGPEAVGAAALAAALLGLVQPILGQALTNALVQRPHLTEAEVAAALHAMLRLAALASAAGLAVALLAPPGWLGPGVAPLLAALALGLPAAWAVEGVANGVLLRRQDARALALRGGAAQAAGFVAGVGLALGGAGAAAPVAQQIAFFGTAALVAAVLARLPRPAGRAPPAALRAMRPYAMASVAAGFAQRAGPRLFLLVAAGGQPALAGLLQIAFRLAEQARDLPAPFVHRFALPPLSRLAPDRAAFLQRLDALALLSGLAFAPAFAGLALCAREVQALLLGPGWAGVAAPLAVLAATLALLAPRLPLGLAFTAAGRPEVGLRLTLLSLGLLVALAVAAAGHGGMAAAVAWAMSLLLGTLAAGVAAAWCLGWGLARQARGWALSLLPAAAVAAAVLGAEAGGLLPDGPLGALAAKAALGGLAGLPAMLALARRPWREIASAAA